MKQKLIVEDSAHSFSMTMNNLLKAGWYYIPDTMKVNMSADGRTERFVAMLVQDEEADALIEMIKQKMAEEGGGCGCPSEAHNGSVPPPFFQSPDTEPHSNDGLTQDKKQ